MTVEEATRQLERRCGPPLVTLRPTNAFGISLPNGALGGWLTVIVANSAVRVPIHNRNQARQRPDLYVNVSDIRFALREAAKLRRAARRKRLQNLCRQALVTCERAFRRLLPQRCPDCGRRVGDLLADGPGTPAVGYGCPACGVEWEVTR